MHYAQFNRRQTRGFPRGEDCRASNGWHRGVKVHRRRWRNPNSSQRTTGGSGCSRPDGLTVPTAASLEETPQGSAVGRDAVRITECREVTAASERPSDRPPKHSPKFCAEDPSEHRRGRLRLDSLDDDSEGAGFQLRQAGRKDLRNGSFEDGPSRAEPGGREIEIARRGDIPQLVDGF